jgi:hypothetical protein
MALLRHTKLNIDAEEYYLVERDPLYSGRRLPTFQKNLLSLTSGLKRDE